MVLLSNTFPGWSSLRALNLKLSNQVKIMVQKVKDAIHTFMNPSADYFDSEYTKRKAAEECCELATALLQGINKRRAMNDQQIEDEIADVLMWVNELAKHYDSDYINARIEKKKTNYFKDGKLHHNYL